MSNTEILETFRNERQPVECWERVMGYHRPVTAWNAGKQAEHRERRYFTEQAVTASRSGSI